MHVPQRISNSETNEGLPKGNETFLKSTLLA